MSDRVGACWLAVSLAVTALAPLSCSDDETAPGSTTTLPVGGGGGGTATGGGGAPPDGPTATVQPTAIDDLLYNPGMGFADFHGNAPPLSEHPTPTVAYYRWTWARLEPIDGQIDFDFVDGQIAAAKAKGETFSFRIMTVYQDSSPQWLLDLGVASVATNGSVFPDHNDPLFLQYQERLVRAFGARYAGSPDIDHVDIGSVGCWGEWNTACCDDASQATCDQYYPTEANQEAIVDWYVEAFPDTPLVMLIGGNAEYAVSRGAGWRGDCFGDYGVFGPNWNHMDDSYGPAAADPIIGEAWKTAPVQFEVCGVMQDWHDAGFDIDLILQKGLEWHMSVLNAKSSPVPADWRAQVDEFHKAMGYRMVLQELTHTSEAAPGESLLMHSDWENGGVAPVYHPWPLAYRLRNSSDEVATQWQSSADLTTWLPGSHRVEEVLSLPSDVAAGTYALDVAILTEDGEQAHVQLAIDGARADLWYPVSEIQVTN